MTAPVRLAQFTGAIPAEIAGLKGGNLNSLEDLKPLHFNPKNAALKKGRIFVILIGLSSKRKRTAHSAAPALDMADAM